MAYTNRIEVVNLDEMSDFERINQNIQEILVNAEGTLPGNRGFGLSSEFLSDIPPDALSDLAQDLDEKLRTYVPEAAVSGVEIVEANDGSLTLRIEIEASEEDDDE